MSSQSVRSIGSAVWLLLCGCSGLWDPFLAQRDRSMQPDGGTTLPAPTNGVCPNDNICWQNPLPQGNRLNAVHAISANNVWAVGVLGTVLRFNGQRWTQVPLKTTAHLNDITATAGTDDVWSVGDSGTVVQWSGTEAVVRPLNSAGQLFAVRGVSKQLAFAAGQDGAALRWDGMQWVQTGPPAPFTTFRGIIALDAGNVWIGQQNGFIQRWLAQPDTVELSNSSGNLMHLWGSSQNNLWAVGEKGFVLTRRGPVEVPWKFITAPNTANLYRIWGTGGADLWAVGEAGSIHHIDGMQERISSEVSGSTDDLFGVSGSSSSDVWAVGDNGALLHRDGTGWTSLRQGTTRPIRALWAASSTDAWAVGSAGLILHWDGSAWNEVASNTAEDLRAISGSAANDIWAVGRSGVTLHWNGTSWSPGTTVIGASALNGLYTPNAATTWVVGNGKQIYSYEAGTKTWKMYSLGGTGELLAIGGSGPSDIWATGQGGTIAHYNGASWQIEPNASGLDLYSLWVSPSRSVWFVGDMSMALFWDASTQMLRQRATGLAGALRAVWGFDDSRVYAAGEVGSFFQFDGVGWGSLPSGTNRSLYAIGGSQIGQTTSTQFWLAGDKGTILQVKQ